MKRKTILTFCLIFFTFLVKAQDADTLLNLSLDTTANEVEAVTDSVAFIDSIMENEEDDEDDEKDYFLQKSMTANWQDSFLLRKIPDSALQAMRQYEDFWYANTVFEKKKQKEEPRRQSADLSWLNTLLWVVIIGGFLTFIVILLTNGNVNLFRRSKAIGAEETEGYAETNDIFAINYQKEIDKAVNAGNFRLAVRFMFLRLLRNLSDKNVIQYTQDRTNFDYLLQVHNTAWYTGFFRIVRNYEYAWYGHFEVDKEKFDVIRKDFDGFDKQLNRS